MDRDLIAREVTEKLGLKLEGHTPGPWQLEQRNDRQVGPNIRKVYEIVGHHKAVLAVVLSDQWYSHDGHANAELLKAAPTLWNALLDSEEKCRKLEQELSVYKASLERE